TCETVFGARRIATPVLVRGREERCSALRGIELPPANSVSHRGPKERKVRKALAATNEYRDCDESNNALRKSTTPGSPCSCSTSDSGEGAETFSSLNGHIASALGVCY